MCRKIKRPRKRTACQLAAIHRYRQQLQRARRQARRAGVSNNARSRVQPRKLNPMPLAAGAPQSYDVFARLKRWVLTGDWREHLILSGSRTALAVVLVMAGVTAVQSVPASMAATNVCGRVVHPPGWSPRTGAVVRLSTRVSCKTAIRVAQAAMNKHFHFGVEFEALGEWTCKVAQRPEAGHRPVYLMKCTRGPDSTPLIGVK
jgi:hypothetical protein